MRTRIPPSVPAGAAALGAGIWLALVHQAAGLSRGRAVARVHRRP